MRLLDAALVEPPARAPEARARPAASVIIVSYNAAGYLPACLSTLAGSLGAGDEVIVVDSGSSDGSADLVARMFPEVRLIRSATNVGYAGGNNLGARAASREYLAFLNPDTQVEPGWLDVLVAELADDPRAGLATSQILLLQDPGRVNAAGNSVHLTGLTLCRGMGVTRDALGAEAEVAAVSGAAFAIRRALFEQLGGFDPAFFLYMEDTDLSQRARLAGYSVRYLPRSVVYHDYQLRFGPRKTYYQERNRYLMLLKNLRWQTLGVLAPALLVAELVTWAYVLLREPRRWRNKLAAYLWIAANWRRVMGLRRAAQALRRAPDHALLAGWTATIDYRQAGDSRAARAAEALLNPLFGALRAVVLLVVRW